LAHLAEISSHKASIIGCVAEFGAAASEKKVILQIRGPDGIIRVKETGRI
jgi:hypothetical protein